MECDGEIPRARLQAVPGATRCVLCEGVIERRGRMVGPGVAPELPSTAATAVRFRRADKQKTVFLRLRAKHGREQVLPAGSVRRAWKERDAALAAGEHPVACAFSDLTGGSGR